MCPITTGRPLSATAAGIAGSNVSPETSLTTSTPASAARRATSAFVVSIERSGRRGPSRASAGTTASSTGITRRSSSRSGTLRDPGRVDSPPTSMIAAPSSAIRTACSTAWRGRRKRPPSEKESGVTFRIPITGTLLPSGRAPRRRRSARGRASKWRNASAISATAARASGRRVARRRISTKRAASPPGRRAARRGGTASRRTQRNARLAGRRAPGRGPRRRVGSPSRRRSSSRAGSAAEAVINALWVIGRRTDGRGTARPSEGCRGKRPAPEARPRARGSRGLLDRAGGDRRTGPVALARLGGGPERLGGGLDPARRPLARRQGGQVLPLHQRRDLLAVEHLVLQERLRDPDQGVAVGLQDLLRPLVRLQGEPLDLLVDQDGGRFAVVLVLGDLPAEEDLLLLLAEGQRSHRRAHAPLADHLARHLGRLLEIVAGAGREDAHEHLLRHAATHHDRERALEVLARVVVAVVDRELLRDSQRHAARNDGDLVDRVGVRHGVGRERVPRLVIRGQPLLLLGDDEGAALGAHQDLVLGPLEVLHEDELLVVARGVQGRLVDQVREIGPGEARRAARQDREVDVLRERDLAGVDLEDLLAPLDVGAGDHDAPVEAAGSQQRRIEDVRPVGGGDQDDAVVRFEAVHLDQELVEGLLALVVTAAEPRAAVPPDRVDLVDEDDAGGVLLALLKQVPDPRGADPDEHLDEVRSRDREEGHVRLAGDRPRQERLAGPRRAHQQDPLRDLAAQLLELLRLLEELDDLLQLLLGLIHPGDVLEGHLLRLAARQARLRLAEGESLVAAALHLTHEEDPDADHE